ncbi:hypothetical protein FisN_14Lh074 [Fistulifera solaris]|uniref:NADP-dependent oxidoreductase domain-containing protein n=1 Tax=Fistulifera solaris TaxID=1519565 RepID=A0A1Z5J9B2_FISSO|nr:hypothetical protein FisN_14Lh074 [Fistulifera solaris]|eukprot:GAX10575.1 hypothetical protein FisN_14Lh074 [Fistulifera solaris]
MIRSVRLLLFELLLIFSDAFLHVHDGTHLRHKQFRQQSHSFFSLATRRAVPPDASNGHWLRIESSTDHPEVLSSDFWGTVTRNHEKPTPILPCVPTLDHDGPLPEGAYFQSLHNQHRCRIGVALDIPSLWVHFKEERIEKDSVVRALQNYVESGFQNFHLRTHTIEQQQWAETEILGKFYRETPSFCRNQCHFTIPYNVAQIVQQMNFGPRSHSRIIRQSIFEILDRTGAEVIDCLQLREVSSSSPYFFDILDSLQDLQREGYIASIDAHQLPAVPQMLADEYGFLLDTMHCDANLLEMSQYQDQVDHLRQTKLDHPLIVASPLAGGLLTDRYCGQRDVMQSWEFRYRERYSWNTVYETWAQRNRMAMKSTSTRTGVPSVDLEDAIADNLDQQGRWKMYQTQVLSALHRIARKHSVSISSIVLRWILQLEKVSGTIVTCQLVYPDDGLVRTPRERQLRQVFTFALDDDDMSVLGGMADLDAPKKCEDLEDLSDEMMVKETSGLFIPSKKRNR